ncbi:MAG: hypothetical protein WCT32_01820 [Patescibacteria group bacterium]|jgi:hypothetical protein
MERKNTLVLIFFGWWYGEALTKLFVFQKRFLAYLADMFSLRICLKTLFAPWRRDQTGTQGLSLQEMFHVWGLNAASRLIGFMVKAFTIIAFLLIFVTGIVCSIIAIVVWIAWPIIGIAFALNGLRILIGW